MAVAVLTYLVINQTRKLEVYEEWVQHFGDEIQNTYVRLKQVDERNIFEKDDDVGFVFSELLRISDEFNQKVK